MQRDCRDQRRDSREIVFRQQLTYSGSGYRYFLVTQSFNFNQFDGRCGDSRRFQLVAYILVVLGGNAIKGFSIDKAVSYIQRGSEVLTENFQINFGVIMVNDVLFFNEVVRERSAGDDVFGVTMYSQAWNIGGVF